MNYLADEGYQPEFGARELRRQIRQQLETKLASEMLRGNISEGDTVKVRYDRSSGTIAFESSQKEPALAANNVSQA